MTLIPLRTDPADEGAFRRAMRRYLPPENAPPMAPPPVRVTERDLAHDRRCRVPHCGGRLLRDRDSLTCHLCGRGPDLEIRSP